MAREDKVVEVIRNAANGDADNLIHLSTGVVLKPSRVPNLLISEVVSKFKRPEPPTVFIEDIGRSEQNPNDPTYIDLVNQWQVEMTTALVDTMILVGTEVHSVPKGFSGPSDEGWTKKIHILGIDPGTDEYKRYLMWIKFHAAPSEKDISTIMEEVGRVSGVSESDVSEAIQQFRDNPK